MPQLRERVVLASPRIGAGVVRGIVFAPVVGRILIRARVDLVQQNTKNVAACLLQSILSALKNLLSYLV